MDGGGDCVVSKRLGLIIFLVMCASFFLIAPGRVMAANLSFYAYPEFTRGVNTSAELLQATGEEYLIVRGLDDAVYYCIFSRASGLWGDWSGLPGATCDRPAATIHQGMLHIVIRGIDGESLWHGYVDIGTSGFSGWVQMQGAALSAPTLTSDGGGMCLVVRGLDNRVYYSRYSGGSWGDWVDITAGSTCDSPAAALYTGNLYIVVRGMDGQSLWFGQVDLGDDSFSGWTLLPGATIAAPTIAPDGEIFYLVVRGRNNKIYGNMWNGTGWEGWTPLLTGATWDSPTAVIAGGELHIVTRGRQRFTLWHCHADPFTPNRGGFSIFSHVDGATASPPTLVGPGNAVPQYALHRVR